MKRSIKPLLLVVSTAINIMIFFGLAFHAHALEIFSHQYLMEQILKSSTLNSYLISNLGLVGGIKDKINGEEVLYWFNEGVKKEDEPINTRSFNHFHDPLKIWNSAGFKGIFKSSIVWSQDQGAFGSLFGGDWTWKKARDSFYKGLTEITKTEREKNLADTFRALGQVMHLVQDASVPAHVRNDTHVYLDLLGIKIGGFHYEIWVKNNHSLLNLNPVSFDQSILNLIPESSAPIPIANIFDTNRYTGLNPNVATGSNIGITEFTNANFFSEGTIFKDYPHPTKENTNANLIEQIAKDGKTDKVWYIQGYTSQRLAAYSYLWNYSNIIPKKEWLYNLDNYVYADYAQKLIPRAVGYSAGLLNYFFRGEMNMVPDDATGSGYVIENNTDEDMSGIFELWYDNKNEERVKVWNSSLNIGKKSSGNNKSTNITFTPPTDTKEPDKYMLVFRGKLGNEEDAVVGKEVSLLPLLIFLHNGQNTLFMAFDKDLKLTPYPPFTLTFGNAGLSGIETSPATIQSNKEFTEHYYMPSTTQNKNIPSSYFQKYGRLSPHLLGNRNSFTPLGWDKNSPLQYNTDLSYLSYPSDYISSGRHDWAYSGDSVIKNLEAWKEADNKPHIRYTTKDGVVKGDSLPFSEVFAILSPNKVIGISSDTNNESSYTEGSRIALRQCTAKAYDHELYGGELPSGGSEKSRYGYGFYFGDVLLDYGASTYDGNSSFIGIIASCYCGPWAGGPFDYPGFSFNVESWSSSSYDIKDYDNINGETFIVIYTKTGSMRKSNGIWSWPDKWGEDFDIETSTDYGSAKSFQIAYRIRGGGFRQEEICWNGSVNTEHSILNSNICNHDYDYDYDYTYSHQFKGQAMFNPSTKIFDFNGKTYIAYSYSIYDYIGDPQVANFNSELLSDWQFNRRIVGLIDADTGQKSETEINDSFLGNTYNFFDKTLYGAIGFHNGNIK